MGFLKGLALTLVGLVGFVILGALGLFFSALVSMSGFVLTGLLALALIVHGVWEGCHKPKKPP